MNRKKKRVSAQKALTERAPENISIDGYSAPGEKTPESNPDFVFGDELGPVLAWFEHGERDGLYLTGPTQCGKTGIIREICARANLELFEENGHRDMEVSDLIGQYVIEDGNMIWKEGPLAAAQRLGCPFLINEIDTIDPGVALFLIKILDAQVESKNGFRLIATANTNGGSAFDDVYAGTTSQNGALLERFWMIEMSYLAKDREIDIVAEGRNVSRLVVERMHAITEVTRGGDYQLPMSTRSFSRWVLVYSLLGGADTGGDALIKALNLAYANRLQEDEKNALHEMLQRHFGGANSSKAA